MAKRILQTLIKTLQNTNQVDVRIGKAMEIKSDRLYVKCKNYDDFLNRCIS